MVVRLDMSATTELRKSVQIQTLAPPAKPAPIASVQFRPITTMPASARRPIGPAGEVGP